MLVQIGLSLRSIPLIDHTFSLPQEPRSLIQPSPHQRDRF
jgi:hypothetical protein